MGPGRKQEPSRKSMTGSVLPFSRSKSKLSTGKDWYYSTETDASKIEYSAGEEMCAGKIFFWILDDDNPDYSCREYCRGWSMERVDGAWAWVKRW